MIEYMKRHGFDMEYEMEMSFIDIEKEQIIKAFESQKNCVEKYYEYAEQYYNEIYGEK
jgi:hypothetical protein